MSLFYELIALVEFSLGFNQDILPSSSLSSKYALKSQNVLKILLKKQFHTHILCLFYMYFYSCNSQYLHINMDQITV